MRNIYGENKNLTAAQKKLYVELLQGTIFEEYGSRRFKSLECLRLMGFVRVDHVFGNGIRYARWM